MSSVESRLCIERLLAARAASTLADDVRAGLSAHPKELPPKYFYDVEGSRLFDAICDTPEYYPTRTEAGLLEQHAPSIIARVDPTHLVELGSGTARKTRLLLRALGRHRGSGTYVPLDVAETTLVASARALLEELPWLRVHGLLGDYLEGLGRVPRQGTQLVAFLGGTIGNFTPREAVEFLRAVGDRMRPGDRLLLGTDLVKDRALLDAAYNDAQGLTARFNKNVLRVINRELGGEFDLDDFEHLAFFHEGRAQIEMHLRARRRRTVRIAALEMQVLFEAGETVRTEISRKFTRESATALLEDAGFRLGEWYAPENDWFALSLSEPTPR